MAVRPALDRVITGLPLWLLREYLQELGGRQAGDGWLVGRGWSARLAQVEDFQVGSLRVGQVRLQVHATAEVLEALRPRLEQKLLRGGG